MSRWSYIVAAAVMWGWLRHGVSIGRSTWLVLNTYDTCKTLELCRRLPKTRRRVHRRALQSTLITWIVYIPGIVLVETTDILFSWIPLYPTIRSVLLVLFLLMRISMSSHVYQTFLVPLMKDYEHAIDIFVGFVSFVGALSYHHAIRVPLEYFNSRLPRIPFATYDKTLEKIMDDLALPGGIMRPSTPVGIDTAEDESMSIDTETFATPVRIVAHERITRRREIELPVASDAGSSARPARQQAWSQTFDEATTVTPGRKRKAVVKELDQPVVRRSTRNKPDPKWSPVAKRPSDPSSSRPTRTRKPRTTHVEGRGPPRTVTRSAMKRKREASEDELRTPSKRREVSRDEPVFKPGARRAKSPLRVIEDKTPQRRGRPAAGHRSHAQNID